MNQKVRQIYNCLFVVVLFDIVFLIASCSEQPTSPSNVGAQYSSTTESLKRIAQVCAEGIKNQVVKMRGISFKRPVQISVMMRSEYQAALAQDADQELTDSMKQVINRIFLSEGLIRPGMDYFSDEESVYGSSVGGYYRTGTDSFYLVLPDGVHQLTTLDSVTIFHELVHALQDQCFPLEPLQRACSSSDQVRAFRSVVEGEAEMLSTQYHFKLIYNYLPDSLQMSMILEDFQAGYDAYCQDLHDSGYCYFSVMPFFESYSYGPLFINAVTHYDRWLEIENVFLRMPGKMREIMHPEKYLNPDLSEYLIDLAPLRTFFGSRWVQYDNDALGESALRVIFREWGNSSFASISVGLKSDRIAVYGNASTDTLMMFWHTIWQDSVAAARFVNAYKPIAEQKWGVTLSHSDSADVDQQTHKVYLGHASNKVWIMENYPVANEAVLFSTLKNAPVYNGDIILTKQSGDASFSRVWLKKRELF